MTQSTLLNPLFRASVHSWKILFKNSVFKYERTKFAKLMEIHNEMTFQLMKP